MPCTTNCRRKPSLVSAFSEEEYIKRIAALKNNTAAGIDDILVEKLKNLGPKAHKWLHTMLNICFIVNKIPKIWRQSKIIAILKPGKDSVIPKNYILISLLCHTYKLYERLILTSLSISKMVTREALIPVQLLWTCLQLTTQCTIGSSSQNSTTQPRTANYVESFRTFCPTEDSMWN